MLYLLKNLEIIDSDIVEKRGNVWSCNQLITSITDDGENLLYHTANNDTIKAGKILRKSENIIDLIHEGLQMNYKDNWYTILRLEGLEGLFIALPNKISSTQYQIVYTDVEALCAENNNYVKLRKKPND